MKKRPILDEFWEKVDRRGNDECWPWKAYVNQNGYGVFHLGRKTVLAHRFSYQINVGEIPDGKSVLHKCDNRPCINPAHLYPGTALDNARDRETRGRAVYLPGAANGRAILTAVQVAAIRARHSQGGITLTELGKQYGVGRPAIGHIVRGRNWK